MHFPGMKWLVWPVYLLFLFWLPFRVCPADLGIELLTLWAPPLVPRGFAEARKPTVIMKGTWDHMLVQHLCCY